MLATVGQVAHGSARPAGALSAYEKGISVAEAKGDIQAAKEMKVFAKRLRSALSEAAGKT